MIVCAVCHHSELEGEIFCAECGARLVPAWDDDHPTTVFPEPGSAMRSTRAATPRQLVLKPGQVMLHIAGVPDPVPLEGQSEYVFGRDRHTGGLSQVNLNAYGAQEKGVSRVHAALRREKERWVVVDLGSTNGTRLNGTRLAPQQPAPLADGDEIRLGGLAMRVTFG